MSAVSLMIASQVLVVDQGVQLVARRLVPLLSERRLTAGLGLVWQTAIPGRSPAPVMLGLWLAVSLAVIVGLLVTLRRPRLTLVPLQAVALGLILGGSAAHVVDLLRWGDVVATLHVRWFGLAALTGVARLAQWGGLLLVVVSAVGRRRSV